MARSSAPWAGRAGARAPERSRLRAAPQGETGPRAGSESVATHLLRDVDLPGSPTRVGWPIKAEGDWVACITGCCRPAGGELVGLFLRTKNQWQTVVVTEVLDGRSGARIGLRGWPVRRFLEVGRAVAPRVPAAALVGGRDPRRGWGRGLRHAGGLGGRSAIGPRADPRATGGSGIGPQVAHVEGDVGADGRALSVIAKSPPPPLE